MNRPAIRAALLACVLSVPGVAMAQTPQAPAGSPLPSVRLWGGYELSDPSGNLWGSASSVVTLCPNTTNTGTGYAQVCPGSSASNPLYVSGGSSGSTSSTVTQGPAGTASWPVADTQSAPFGGEVAMTVGTTYAAGRGVKANCTAAGVTSITYADGSTGLWPGALGIQVWAVAATAINASGTTATCTYGELK